MRCVHPDMELLIAASATRSLMASTFAVKVRCIAQHIESPKGIYTLLIVSFNLHVMTSDYLGLHAGQLQGGQSPSDSAAYPAGVVLPAVLYSHQEHSQQA